MAGYDSDGHRKGIKRHLTKVRHLRDLLGFTIRRLEQHSLDMEAQGQPIDTSYAQTVAKLAETHYKFVKILEDQKVDENLRKQLEDLRKSKFGLTKVS